MKRRDGYVLLALVALLVVGVAVALLLPQRQAAPAAEVANPRTAWRICQDKVRDGLKAPSSADFPAYDEAAVGHSRQQWTVRSYVDADNSFGAKLRTRYTCTLHFDGALWSVESLDVN